jgi:hypothetical protein
MTTIEQYIDNVTDEHIICIIEEREDAVIRPVPETYVRIVLPLDSDSTRVKIKEIQSEQVMFDDDVTVDNYEQMENVLRQLLMYYKPQHSKEFFQIFTEEFKQRVAAEHDFVEPEQL